MQRYTGWITATRFSARLLWKMMIFQNDVTTVDRRSVLQNLKHENNRNFTIWQAKCSCLKVIVKFWLLLNSQMGKQGASGSQSIDLEREFRSMKFRSRFIYNETTSK